MRHVYRKCSKLLYSRNRRWDMNHILWHTCPISPISNPRGRAVAKQSKFASLRHSSSPKTWSPRIHAQMLIQSKFRRDNAVRFFEDHICTIRVLATPFLVKQVWDYNSEWKLWLILCGNKHPPYEFYPMCGNPYHLESSTFCIWKECMFFIRKTLHIILWRKLSSIVPYPDLQNFRLLDPGILIMKRFVYLIGAFVRFNRTFSPCGGQKSGGLATLPIVCW